MLFLPEDIIGEIVEYLNIGDICKLERVSRHFSKVRRFCLEIVIIKGAEISDDLLISCGCKGGYFGCKKVVIRRSEFLTGAGLQMLGLQFDKLVELNLVRCQGIVDEDIKEMTSLEVLKLQRCKKITNDGIVGLKRMQILDLSTALAVSDAGIEEMTDMEELWLFFNLRVTMKGVESMQKLRVIMMAYNGFVIKDELLCKLSALEKIYLRQ